MVNMHVQYVVLEKYLDVQEAEESSFIMSIYNSSMRTIVIELPKKISLMSKKWVGKNHKE